MADDFLNVMSSIDQMRNNYEQFKDKFVDRDKDLISQETFLKLLVAEMSNQDPLEPTSNTEFISQLAQFSSMQYLQDSSKYSMANYASSLVGKTVSASKMDGVDLVIKTGVVEKVVYKNNTYVLTIDGEDFDISKVTSIVDGSSSSGSSGAGDLSDKIIRASQMVGMYAWVKTGQKDANGNEQFVQGFIESIIVKDGDVRIVIGGTDYSIEDIDELTFATVVDGSGDPEKPGDAEDPDDVEGVDPTDPGEGTDGETDGTDGVGGTEGAEGTEGNNGTEGTEGTGGTEFPETDDSTAGSNTVRTPEEERILLEQLRDLIGSM